MAPHRASRLLSSCSDCPPFDSLPSELVASAHRTLMANVSKKESLPKEASEAERARVEQAVAAARLIKDNEESKLEAAVEDEEKKWAQLVEVSEAVEAQVANVCGLNPGP